MSNVLMFPLSAQEVSLFEKIKNFIDNKKIEKQKRYKIKVEALRRETYFWYLQRILKMQSKDEVDFPMFLYLTRDVINGEAQRLTDIAIQQAETQGRGHIEKCYKRLIGN